jgi:hypothetical protein
MIHPAFPIEFQNAENQREAFFAIRQELQSEERRCKFPLFG